MLNHSTPQPMDRPTLEDLKARFEEMKAEQDYIRTKFFECFSSLHYPEGHKFYQLLKEKGPPVMVIMHPSTAKRVDPCNILQDYCILHLIPSMKPNKIAFSWEKDVQETTNQIADSYQKKFNQN